MKKDIILAGVGGQGILTIATIIGDAAVAAGLSLKQAEVHGMSQRGGDVQSNLRLSTEPIYSDLIKQGGDFLVDLLNSRFQHIRNFFLGVALRPHPLDLGGVFPPRHYSSTSSVGRA